MTMHHEISDRGSLLLASPADVLRGSSRIHSCPTDGSQLEMVPRSLFFTEFPIPCPRVLMRRTNKYYKKFDVVLMSNIRKKVFLVKYNSKLLWLAKSWCTPLPLAGKLEKCLLHWLALSSFCYFQLSWLVDKHLTYSWLGFLFLKTLAGWQ